MHTRAEATLARADRLVSDWIRPAVVRERRALHLTAWEAPGEPVTFAHARSQTYEPVAIGDRWGRPWGTTWFHAVGDVPDGWPLDGTRLEIDVDLGFDDQMPGFQAEGAAWSPTGELIKGISPRNSWVPLPQTAAGAVDLFVEAAANPDVYRGSYTTPSPMGDLATAGDGPIYQLRRLEIVLVDTEVEALAADIRTLRGLAGVLDPSTPRRAELVAALEDMCDAVDPTDVAGTATAGRAALAPALAQPAAASAHRIHAVGHAHIDSAWLWPIRETARKVARTVANVLALMDEDPTFTYAFSSAQQYAWLAESYPELFERLRARVQEGRVVPVGGMWVESDLTLIGGESLARQLVHGTRWFREHLGVDSTVMWLPDSFGYTGALPQLGRLAGMTDLFAQKMCWNDTNPFPHHTFWWEGVDGSRLFTHFTPMDTYNARLVAPQLERASTQFADKGRTNVSLAAFGFGDGGGGPNRRMLAQAHRVASLDGSPSVEMSTPERFFDVARQYADDAPTWVGEMYLEFHRGTYTSQARTKRGNRRSEHLLREAELWATTAAVRTGAPYPADALQRIWRLVLLLQFHDILPGSSIAWVHREAEAHHEAITRELEEIIAASLAALGVAGDAVANASPFDRDGVPAGGIGVPTPRTAATLTPDGDGWLLANEAVRVRVDHRGLVTSAVTLVDGREAIAPGQVGNLLQTFRDIPNDFEAWDIDHHYQRVGTDHLQAESVEVVDGGLRVVRSFGTSRVVQHLTLASGDDPTLHVRTEVDWHERRTLLKLGFTFDVAATDFASEMQLGHVRRPTHTNTSWDAARFETPAHRWVHVGEPGYGVAVGNDATYGHDVTRVRLPDGTAVRVRQSLLRAPMFPDPESDQGAHTLRTSVTFGADVLTAVEQGYALNLPPRRPAECAAGQHVEPLVHVDDRRVVLEAVKLAEDRSGDVVVRLYEATGARVATTVRIDSPHHEIVVTDLHETPQRLVETHGDEIALTLRPFEVVTLRAVGAGSTRPDQ